MRRPGLRTFGVRSAGLVFLLVLAGFVSVTVMIYDKDFVSSVPVTLRTGRVGNQLHTGGEVKARGVVVGEVRKVRSAPEGAEVDLALEPGKVDRLPRDLSVLLVPKTLFGERYVQLSIPDRSTAPPLAAGDVINEDRSANAIELEQVFDGLLPVLRAVQPQKLASTLSAAATALQGRGKQLGDTLAQSGSYLSEFNKSLPQLNDDIRDLATVSNLYGDIAPDLLDALSDSAVTLNTVQEKRAELSPLYARVTSSAEDLTTFLRQNKENLIGLASASRDPLEVAARYSPSFPCTLRALVDLKPSVDKLFGAGTGQPGAHVDIEITRSNGKYVPGKDTPSYSAAGEPRCYPSGVTPRAGVPVSSAGTAATAVPASGDLGIANSPQERDLLAGLLAPDLGQLPADVPSWSSVLVGPLYRGAQVNLR